MTAAEQERLAALAAAADVSVPRLLVESALAGGPESAAARAATSAELVALGRALGRVGVNVNQIAKASHATGEVPETTADTLAAIREVTARLTVVLDGIDASRVARGTAGRRDAS
ncbi:MAG: plasmid mobilization relaxosome protein MobC [Sporichthyaceae bacterium]